jgi:hypothetical protein
MRADRRQGTIAIFSEASRQSQKSLLLYNCEAIEREKPVFSILKQYPSSSGQYEPGLYMNDIDIKGP